MTRPHRFRLDDLVETWMLHAGLLAWAVGLVTATWSSGSVLRWFCGVASATALVATLPPLGPIGIRRVRFAAGATTASAGAVLTLQLGFMLQQPEAEDPQGFSGTMALALLTAALGGWIAEERLERLARDEARRRDELAESRHAELLKAVGGASREREALRAGEVVVALGLLMLRRR